MRGIAWPEPYTGRAVQNDFVARWHQGDGKLVDDLAERERSLEPAEAGDFDTAMIFAGQILDVGRAEPTRAIFERMGREAEDWLRSAPHRSPSPTAVPTEAQDVCQTFRQLR